MLWLLPFLFPVPVRLPEGMVSWSTLRGVDGWLSIVEGRRPYSGVPLYSVSILPVYESIQKQAANQHHPSLLSIICALPRCDTLCRSSTPMACVIDTILTVTMLFSIRGMTCMVINGYACLTCCFCLLFYPVLSVLLAR